MKVSPSRSFVIVHIRNYIFLLNLYTYLFDWFKFNFFNSFLIGKLEEQCHLAGRYTSGRIHSQAMGGGEKQISYFLVLSSTQIVSDHIALYCIVLKRDDNKLISAKNNISDDLCLLSGSTQWKYCSIAYSPSNRYFTLSCWTFHYF